MIRIENVSKVFNSGNVDEISALKNVSLQIEAGSFVVIVGSNGSGKSTLLKTIAGINKAISGEVFISGDSISDLSQKQRATKISFASTYRIKEDFIKIEDVVPKKEQQQQSGGGAVASA